MTTAVDKRPIYWTLCVLALLTLIWIAVDYLGEQRQHNTAVWQRWHPVLQKSAAQTASPVQAAPALRVEQTIVQTERGVYFLTGTRYPPAAGEAVMAVANDAWEIYLCAASGEHCMSIHSFCADSTWADLKRDAEGKTPNCYAPRLAQGSNRAVAAITAPPPTRSGSQGGRLRNKPSAGMTHPREWGWKMGLAVPSVGLQDPAK